MIKIKSQDKMDENQIDFNKIDLEKAKFILQESDKLMDVNLKCYDVLDNKINLLRSLLIAILSLVVVLVKLADTYSSILQNQPLTPSLRPFLRPSLRPSLRSSLRSSLTASMVLIGGFLVALIILVFAGRAQSISGLETSPSELSKSKYNSSDLRDFICSQITTYFKIIPNIQRTNEDKAKWLNRASYCTLLSLFLVFLFYFFDANLLSWIFVFSLFFAFSNILIWNYCRFSF